MNNELFWEQFKKTGYISDYLNYTACTTEEQEESITTKQHYDEVVLNGDNTNRNGNSIDCHAHW